MRRSFGKMHDLTILSGEARFDVHRAVVSLASPVWAMMLNGPFAESNRAVIALEEDCPFALCHALEIIYSRFGEENFEAKKITETLAYDEELDVTKESGCEDEEEWQEMEESMTEALEDLVDKYELIVVRNYHEEVERRDEGKFLLTPARMNCSTIVLPLYLINELPTLDDKTLSTFVSLKQVIHLRTKVKKLEKAVLYESNEKASAMGMMSTMSLQLGDYNSMIWQMKSQEMQQMRQTQGICASFNHSTTRMYEENMRLRNEISRLKQVVVRAREMNCLAIDELMGQG